MFNAVGGVLTVDQFLGINYVLFLAVSSDINYTKYSMWNSIRVLYFVVYGRF